VPRTIRLTGHETTKPIHLNGTTQSSDLILNGIKSNELGESYFYRIIRGDERVFNLLGLVVFDGFLLFLSCNSYLLCINHNFLTKEDD
jgi:hypothetical protein